MTISEGIAFYPATAVFHVNDVKLTLKMSLIGGFFQKNLHSRGEASATISIRQYSVASGLDRIADRMPLTSNLFALP